MSNVVETLLEQSGTVLSVTTGFIVASSWNMVLMTMLKHDEETGQVQRPLIYALLVTLLAIVVMTIWFMYVATLLRRLPPLPTSS